MRQRNRICKTEEINVLYKYCPVQYTGELAHQRHSRRDVSIVRGKIETPRVDHFYGHFFYDYEARNMCTCIGLTCCLRAHMKSVFTEIQHAAQCARALAEILGGPSGQLLDELAAERIPARHHALAGAEEDVLGRSLHFNAAGNARGAARSCRHFDPVQADRGGGLLVAARVQGGHPAVRRGGSPVGGRVGESLDDGRLAAPGIAAEKSKLHRPILRGILFGLRE